VSPPARHERTPPVPEPSAQTEDTGLPWLKTWPAVYAFVLAGFLLWVGLLYALSVLYR
jgi:hypothetical protein